MAVVGLIPAAGRATRLQPIPCSKEVLPVRGRPVIDHLMERMRAAPCDELRVVTRPEKEDVIAHAARRGAVVLRERPGSLAESLLAGVAGLAPDDVVLIGFPDSIWEATHGFATTLRLLEEGWSVALGLFESSDLRRYEPVVADADGRVTAIEFKPEHPSSSWLWGCAATTAGVLRGLAGWDEPGIYFDSLAHAGKVGAERLEGRYIDMGTPEGLAEASDVRPADSALLLGSGGWMPTSRRETCSTLVRSGRRALILDAGTGLSRLAEEPHLLSGVEAVDIVLTHFHLDHVVGLAYLPGLDLPAPARLHAPGRWLYGTSSRAILERLVEPPLFALGIDRLVDSVAEIDPRGIEAGPFSIEVRAQHEHDGPTAALRLGDALTYCTDTAVDEGNAALARGCHALLHEAWCTHDARPTEPRTHSSALEAAELAAAAGVDELVMIHIRPGSDEAALAAEARGAMPAATVGSDLQELRLHHLAVGAEAVGRCNA